MTAFFASLRSALPRYLQTRMRAHVGVSRSDRAVSPAWVRCRTPVTMRVTHTGDGERPARTKRNCGGRLPADSEVFGRAGSSSVVRPARCRGTTGSTRQPGWTEALTWPVGPRPLTRRRSHTAGTTGAGTSDGGAVRAEERPTQKNGPLRRALHRAAPTPVRSNPAGGRRRSRRPRECERTGPTPVSIRRAGWDRARYLRRRSL